MDDKPLISIVTVTYNTVHSLEKTIRSVREQTYPNLEYILIDGGSTDGTVDLIKQYDDQITYWVSEPDKGIYDAMNKGILQAKGKWINFMNAGDTFYASTTIEELFSSCQGEGIVYGNIRRRFSTFSRTGYSIHPPHMGLLDWLDDTIHHQSSFIRRDLFLKYGLYSLEYKLISDWEFFFRVLCLHRESCLYKDQLVANFQMDGVSTQNTVLYLNERKQYLQKLWGEEMYGYLQELNQLHHARIPYVFFKLYRSLFKNSFIQKIKLALRSKL